MVITIWNFNNIFHIAHLIFITNNDCILYVLLKKYHVQNYMTIPHWFYQQWGYEIREQIFLRREQSDAFTCNMEPWGQWGHITDGVEDITMFHNIEETMLIQFAYLWNWSFNITIFTKFEDTNDSEEVDDEELLWQTTITQSMDKWDIAMVWHKVKLIHFTRFPFSFWCYEYFNTYNEPWIQVPE